MEVIPSQGRPISAGRSTHVGHFNSTDNKSRDRSQLKCSLVTSVWLIREHGWVAERADQTPSRSVIALAEGPTSIIHPAGTVVEPLAGLSQSIRPPGTLQFCRSQIPAPLPTEVFTKHGCLVDAGTPAGLQNGRIKHPAFAEGTNSVTHFAGPIVEPRTSGRSQPVNPLPWDISRPPIANRGTLPKSSVQSSRRFGGYGNTAGLQRRRTKHPAGVSLPWPSARTASYTWRDQSLNPWQVSAGQSAHLGHSNPADHKSRNLA